jgi:hypothetical protein
MELKSCLQKIFNFSSRVIANLEARSDKNIDNAWKNVDETCGQIFELHPLKAADAFADAFVAGWAGWGDKVATLPFVIVRGTTKLAAKVVGHPVDTHVKPVANTPQDLNNTFTI